MKCSWRSIERVAKIIPKTKQRIKKKYCKNLEPVMTLLILDIVSFSYPLYIIKCNFMKCRSWSFLFTKHRRDFKQEGVMGVLILLLEKIMKILHELINHLGFNDILSLLPFAFKKTRYR